MQLQTQGKVASAREKWNPGTQMGRARGDSKLTPDTHSKVVGDMSNADTLTVTHGRTAGIGKSGASGPFWVNGHKQPGASGAYRNSEH